MHAAVRVEAAPTLRSSRLTPECAISSIKARSACSSGLNGCRAQTMPVAHSNLPAASARARHRRAAIKRPRDVHAELRAHSAPRGTLPRRLFTHSAFGNAFPGSACCRPNRYTVIAESSVAPVIQVNVVDKFFAPHAMELACIVNKLDVST